METKDIIQRIAYFRNRENLSARELSLRIDKHEGYINKLESKDFNLPASVLLEIINALNITPEEFFSNNFMTYKKDRELNDIFSHLSIENKNILISLIKNLK